MEGESSNQVVADDEEAALDEMAAIRSLRIESMEDAEEILQTKIISPKSDGKNGRQLR